MSETHRRRILRSSDALVASSATLLVDVPALTASGGSNSLQSMLDDARREGRNEGYRAAMDEMAAAEASGRAAQMRRVTDTLVAAAEAVHDARSRLVEMGAAEAAELAYELAEAFLQRELAVGQPAVEAVTRALHLVPEGHDVIVRLHPGDVVSADELRALVPDAAVKVIEDPRVDQGGCVVVAGPCRIDTQIGSALERARRVLAELYGTDSTDSPEAAS